MEKFYTTRLTGQPDHPTLYTPEVPVYLASEVDARIAELERENERLSHRIDLFEDGEYICAKCGLRQEPPKQDAPF